MKRIGYRHEDRALIEPYEALLEIAKSRGLDEDSLRVPDTIFLALSVGAVDILVRKFGARPVSWIYRARPLYVAKAGGREVGIIWGAPGAPLAAMVMEDLISAGARTFIGVGIAAAIDPNLDVGDLLIPIKALRGEGTSYYYLPEGEEVGPDGTLADLLYESLRARGFRCLRAAVYSTDAPYRETERLISGLVARGVIAIDMETSAIYAVASYRRVSACSMLLVSSNLRKVKSIGFYSDKVGRALSRAASALYETFAER